MFNPNLTGVNKLVPLLEELKNEFQELYGKYLRSIILFGSYARGDFDKESDIDIMILVDLDNIRQRKYRDILAEKVTDISIKHDVVVSVIDGNYEDFNIRASYVPFYKNVMQEGIKIYAG